MEAVVLSPQKGERQDDYTYQRLETLLVEKYGRAWTSTSTANKTLQWKIGRTVKAPI